MFYVALDVYGNNRYLSFTSFWHDENVICDAMIGMVRENALAKAMINWKL